MFFLNFVIVHKAQCEFPFNLQYVEPSAAESHVGVVNVCFQETFEDLSPQSFFLRIYCCACALTLPFRTL